MACEINSDLVKSGIENEVSKMLNDSGLFEKVDYSLKGIDKISSNLDKITQLFSKIGNNETFYNKIQSDFQIPKDQVQLFKDSEGSNPEEKLTNLLADYSHVIKINTAKTLIPKADTEINTSHYSNLTVPGGTNYTENEIATPDITPSIKGHAQFSTDNGIGWFRSDDIAKKGEVFGSQFSGFQKIANGLVTDPADIDDLKEDLIDGKITPEKFTELTGLTNISNSNNTFKTRRILEVQSDLFQKGRDKNNIINKQETAYNKGDEGVTKDNNFLQLLNKDNNWVTFFVKSIIQDSVKKGYEKVLFPTGDTAAKVEGHETIADFIKDKENRIERLEESKLDSRVSDYSEEGYHYYKDEKTGKYMKYPDNDTRNTTQVTDEEYKKVKQIEIDYHNYEIKQLEKELEEAKAGKLKIGSIHSFYENTLTNILKKQGNIKTITDEYGNTWNEYTLSNKDNSRIFFGMKQENTFKPKNENSTYQDTIDDINNQFGEQIIDKTDDGYIISPTEPLIANYENFAKDSDIWDSSAKEFESYDNKNVRNEAGLTELSTPDDFIRDNMQQFAKQIDIIKKANSSFSIEFSDETSQYDPSSNKVFISLPELYDVYKNLNKDIPFKQIISNMILHEMEHAGLYNAIETGNNKNTVKSFLDKVKEYHKASPFIDHMREGYIQSGEPYAFQDEHEFASEAMSNPYFQDYLKKVPNTEEKSVWQSFVDFLKKIFGFGDTPSMYNEVVNFLNSDRVRQQNSDGLEYSSAEWNPELSYRGMPRSYAMAAYNLFTSPAVKDEVDSVLKKLPAAIVKIKKSLDNTTNKNDIKALQSLLSSYNDLKKDDNITVVSINMLTQAAQLSKDLNQQLIDLGKITDPEKQINLSYSLLNQAKSLKFIQPLVKDIIHIIDREGETADIKQFTTQLRGINSVISSIEDTYNKITRSSVVELLTSYVGESEEEKDTKDNISKLQGQISSASDSIKPMLSQAIKIEEAKLRLFPNKENFTKIFNGLYEDSSSLQMNFEAAALNGHPVAGTLMKILNDNNREIKRLMLPLENLHQTELNKLLKSLNVNQLRDTKQVYSPIIDHAEFVDSIKEGEDGKLDIKYFKTRMLLSNYHPDYIKQATTNTAVKNFYFEKLSESLAKGDNSAADEYRTKLDKAYDDIKKFNKENGEQQYDKDINDMYDLLEKDITKPDGTITNFSKERGDIFKTIEDLERSRNGEMLIEVKNRIQEEIGESYIELKQLKSKFNIDGSPKEGFELALSDIANQYSDLKAKNGTWELTEEGRNQFEKDVANLKSRQDLGYISQEEFDRRMGELSVTELSDEYYKASKYYSDQIAQLSSQLAAIPEFRSVFKGINIDKIKEGYEKIRDLVKGFRDNDLTIDGQLFSRVRPELVKEIQSIQQETENLRAASEKMKGLSIEDTIRMKALQKAKNKGVISNDDLDELNQLSDKQTKQNQVYQQNNDLIEKYSFLLASFANLNETTNSSYYNDELETRKGLLKKQRIDKLVDQLKTLSSVEGGKYIKSADGTWSKVIGTDGTYKVIEKVPVDQGFSTPEESIANEIAQGTINDDIKETDWYKDNHFQKNVWNNKQKTFIKQDTPIYIWVKTEPKDKNLILSKQPSIKYKTYKINDGHENPNYKILNDNIPIPLAGKFPNERYETLKKTNNQYYKYLEFAREEYTKGQGSYSDHLKMGDILPSFVKTQDESKVELVNSLKGKMSGLLATNLKLGTQATQDTDEQVLTGGSTSNFFAKNRIIPTRFASKMNEDKQSSDIPAMLLGFSVAALEYNKMLEDQPLAEAIRNQVTKLGVLETKNLSSQFSPGNLFNTIKSKFNNTDSNRSVIREKDTTDKPSNLSKTVDFILDTYMYGETKKAANVDIDGVNVDLNKLSAGLRTMASNSIFLGSLFLPVKNTILVTLEGNIQSNIGKGFFTKAQYNKGHAEAVGYTKQLLSDFPKFGNKSSIGQELDFFSVMQGAAYNQYGHKTAWTSVKNGKSFLLSMKSSLEFELQLAQYLAMSKANPVMVNGQPVEFRKAFKLDSEKGMVPVNGAAVNDKDINSFINKLMFVNRALNGAYRVEEKNALQKTLLGGLAFYLNGFLVEGIKSRFSKTRYSTEADKITKGFHIQMFHFLGDLAKYRTEIGKRWATMTVDERNRVFRSMNEIIVIVAMGLLVGALGGGKKKEELAQNSAIQNWLLSLSMAVRAQTETFIPLPGMGLNDLSTKLNSPFVAMKQITNVLKVTHDVFSWMVGSDDAYYKTTSVHDGIHEKGDNKAVANFLKLAGYSGAPFDPLNKVMQQNKIQQFR